MDEEIPIQFAIVVMAAGAALVAVLAMVGHLGIEIWHASRRERERERLRAKWRWGASGDSTPNRYDRQRRSVSGIATAMGDRKLTPKQQRFVEEYLADPNATQAAIKAGYSKKTADVIGGQLLRKTLVAAKVSAGMARKAEIADLTASRIALEIGRLAKADPRELFGDDGKLLPIKLWPDHIAAAVASVETDTDGRPIKVRLWSKTAALDQAARHLGMFIERMHVTGQVNVTHEFTRDSLALLEDVTAGLPTRPAKRTNGHALAH